MPTKVKIAAAEEQRLRELAESLDLVPESDLEMLTGCTPATVESWRRRRIGPRYTLLGNRFFYERRALREWAATQVRETSSVSAKDTI